jgi:hypothetical protein
LEIVEVNPTEYNPTPRGRRQNAQVDRGAAVETDPTAFHRRADCLLALQTGGAYVFDAQEITGELRIPPVAK